VEKAWTNLAWADAPDVTIDLYANGVRVSAAGTNTYNTDYRSRTFAGLPQWNNATGERIIYGAFEVSQLPTDHYYVSTVDDTARADFEHYFTITNTYATVGGITTTTTTGTPPPPPALTPFEELGVPLGIGDHLHLGDCFD